MDNSKKSFVGKWRAKFVELYSRIITIDKNKDDSIYYNGENNLYPNEIELAILNSHSGKNASKMFAKFVSGKGVFFHIGQELDDDLKLKPVIDVLEYTKTRIGKEDDNEYIGKYWFKDYCV